MNAKPPASQVNRDYIAFRETYEVGGAKLFRIDRNHLHGRGFEFCGLDW